MKKLLLFLFSFLVVFAGITLTNILSCFIFGLADGTMFTMIADLPYILYAIASLIVTIVFFCLVFWRKK